MKRFLSLLMSVFLLSAFVIKGQTPVKEELVPEVVKNNFKKKFPEIKRAIWQSNKDKYEAVFKMDGKMVDATFEKDGAFKSSETHLKKGELPPLVMASIKTSQFTDWKLNDAGFVETSENQSYYMLEMVKGDNEIDLFMDTQGNVITKK
jgi:hypothetical protein